MFGVSSWKMVLLFVVALLLFGKRWVMSLVKG